MCSLMALACNGFVSESMGRTVHCRGSTDLKVLNALCRNSYHSKSRLMLKKRRFQYVQARI